MKTILSILLVLVMLFSAAPAFAASSDIDSMDIVLDTIILRPLGLVSTVFGGTFFVATLPLTGLLDGVRALMGDYTSFETSSIGTSLDLLLKEPAVYTFVRPIGKKRNMD